MARDGLFIGRMHKTRCGRHSAGLTGARAEQSTQGSYEPRSKNIVAKSVGADIGPGDPELQGRILESCKA